MNLIGHDLDKLVEERARRWTRGPLYQASEGVFGSPVHGHKQIELAFFGANLGDVDVEVAERITLEGFLGGLIAFDLAQPARCLVPACHGLADG